jgi:uncharacterized protein (DUF302 family)
MIKFPFGYGKKVSYSFEEALQKVKEAIPKSGFGLLMEIDLQKKIKEKLRKDMGKYCILGICNPTLAFESLSAEIEIGLLLPCNIIVYEKKGEVFIATILPTRIMQGLENNALNAVAEKAEPLLKTILNNL